MKLNLHFSRPVSLIALAVLFTSPVLAQGGARSGGPAPAAATGGARGRGVVIGGGGGPAMVTIPNLDQEQTAAVSAMITRLDPLANALTEARTELVAASIQAPATVKSLAEKIANAELALAGARAEEFGKLQASPERLDADQSKALVAALQSPLGLARVLMAGGARGGRGGGSLTPMPAQAMPVPVAAP